MQKENLIEKLTVFFLLLLFAFIFSYRLTKIPPGINIDESSIGYNASLLSKSTKDENNRLLPVFILTLNGKDWKQPIRVYTTAIFFKLFGVSFFNLRFISVIFGVVSLLLFYLILRLFFSVPISLLGMVIFATSPSILLQSHLALENIDLLPFVLFWLYFLLSYSLKPKKFKLVLSGMFLGVSLYAYKGMRTVVPVYLGLSVIYLVYLWKNKKIKEINSVFYFILGILPFLLPLKWLQAHYAGAIYNPADVGVPSFFQMAQVYLSSFDSSFLFLKGDKMLIHSTGRDGMFLLPNFILFFIGISQLRKENKHGFYFFLICLALTPILLSMVNSIYRASRLMALIPFASFIFLLGFLAIIKIKQRNYRLSLLVLFLILLMVNYVGFIKNYWSNYPKLISSDFSPNFNLAFNKLKQATIDSGKTPYIEDTDFKSHKIDMRFFWEVYFPNQDLMFWIREKENFPENGLVLTSIPGSGEIIVIPSLQPGQKNFYIVNKDAIQK